VLTRKNQPAQSFLQYAVSSIAVALAIGGMAVSAVPNGIMAVRQAIEVEVGHRAESSLRGWKQMTDKQEWRDFVADNPDAVTLSQQVETRCSRSNHWRPSLWRGRCIIGSGGRGLGRHSWRFVTSASTTSSSGG